MANIFQKSFNQLQGWLNTPQGRRLDTDANATATGPSYFPEWRTRTAGPNQGFEREYTSGVPAQGPNQGFEGEYTSGVPTPKTYFPTERVVGGQPPPQQPFRYPEIRSEGQPYFTPTSPVYNPSVQSPQWVRAAAPVKPTVPNIDVAAIEAGGEPSGVEGSKGLPPVTRMIAQRAGQGPPQDVAGTQTYPASVPGGYPGSVMQPRWPSPTQPPGQGAENKDVAAIEGGGYPGTSTPGTTGTVSGYPAAQDEARAPGTYTPGTAAPAGGYPGTVMQPRWSANQTAASQPLGANQGFEGEYSSGVPIAVEHKVVNQDGSSTHVKHTTAQGAAQKQTGGGKTVGQVADQGAGQGQPGQQTINLGKLPQEQPEVRRAYPVGVVPRAQPAQGWAMQPGQNNQVNVQVPSHPGLLQRIGQTISHFFGGTLGQWAPQQQGQPTPDRTGGTALSGISHALAQGRQHIGHGGGTHPASKATPAPPGNWPSQGPPGESWAYRPDWTPRPLGSGDIYNPIAAQPSLVTGTEPDWAWGPYGKTPLASTDITNPPRQF